MTDTPASIAADDVPPRRGSAYPAEFARMLGGREKRALGDVFGLTQFGVNLLTLEPGAMSALRHWHENEDEFVYVIEGEVTLVDDDGEHVLRAGMCAGFRAGRPNAHHLVNRSENAARCLEIGTRARTETSHYADVDMKAVKADGEGWRFVRRDGSAIRRAEDPDDTGAG